MKRFKYTRKVRVASHFQPLYELKNSNKILISFQNLLFDLKKNLVLHKIRKKSYLKFTQNWSYFKTFLLFALSPFYF